MAKTRSQTANVTIKKEEEDIKDTQLLQSVRSTKRNSSKITKRKPTKRSNRRLPVQQVKVEEDTYIKSSLQISQESSKQPISQEQINQLIDYVANHGMSVAKAARKANISGRTANYYYNEYKNDPDKRIPSPRNRYTWATRHYYTQEQIRNVIKYINDDKMSLTEASAKANMSCTTSRYYYRKYLNDPDHNIPIPLNRHYTQDQKRELIRYVVNDKMSITQASKKAKINLGTGKCYCREYFKNQRPDIPTPSHIVPYRERYTQEQVKEVIGYIINDKMTINAASIKANMSPTTATRHYRQYLKDNNMELPVRKHVTCYTQHQINKVVGYIDDDKMTIKDASKKANISYSTVKKYYMEYRKKHNIDSPALKYRQDKIKEIAGYVINDKMSMRAAAKKANMSVSFGNKYYRQYLKDQRCDASN